MSSVLLQFCLCAEISLLCAVVMNLCFEMSSNTQTRALYIQYIHMVSPMPDSLVYNKFCLIMEHFSQTHYGQRISSPGISQY
jgi:hypothetical protein